jgi:nucleotide-binding universal stress UspA family protein
MFEHILLPTGGSELAERAVRKGVEFAKSINARVTGLVSPGRLYVLGTTGCGDAGALPTALDRPC